MAAEPMPASWEKHPRATPQRAASRTEAVDGPGGPARRGGGGEGQAEHLQPRAPGRSGQVPQQHRRARQQVKDRHGGHHRGADSRRSAGCRPRMTTRGQHRHRGAGDPGRDGEAAGQGLGDGVGLGHVPHPQGGQHREQGEQSRQHSPQPLLPQAVRAWCTWGRRTSRRRSLRLAVLHRQQALRALGGQAAAGRRAPSTPGRRGRRPPGPWPRPAMLPVPMVAARVVIRAEKGDTSPAPAGPGAGRPG